MMISPLVLTGSPKRPSLKHNAQDEDASHLMRLPLSIRRTIYGYTLISDDPIEIHALTRRSSVGSRSAERRSTLPRVSLLLQTNSQIRREAAPLYYGRNIFVLPWGFPGLGCRWLYVQRLAYLLEEDYRGLVYLLEEDSKKTSLQTSSEMKLPYIRIPLPSRRYYN